ncbi:hypothetical protein KCU95_g12744, partial [Aureobasidium melanogenum]
MAPPEVLNMKSMVESMINDLVNFVEEHVRENSGTEDPGSEISLVNRVSEEFVKYATSLANTTKTLNEKEEELAALIKQVTTLRDELAQGSTTTSKAIEDKLNEIKTFLDQLSKQEDVTTIEAQRTEASTALEGKTRELERLQAHLSSTQQQLTTVQSSETAAKQAQTAAEKKLQDEQTAHSNTRASLDTTSNSLTAATQLSNANSQAHGEVKGKLENVQRQLDKADRDLADMRGKHNTATTSLSSAQQEVASLKQQVRGLESAKTTVEKQLIEEQTAHGQVQKALTTANSSLKTAQEDHTKVSTELQTLNGQPTSTQTNLRTADEARAKIEQRLEGLETERDAALVEARTTTVGQATLLARMQNLEHDRNTARSDARTADEARAKLEQRLEGLETQRNDARSEARTATDSRATLLARIEALEGERNKAQDDARTADEARAKLEQRLEGLETERDTARLDARTITVGQATLLARVQNLETDRDTARSDARTAEEARAKLEQRLEGLETDRDTARSDARKANNSYIALQSRLQSLQEERNAAESATRQLNQEVGGLRGQIDVLQEELTQASEAAEAAIEAKEESEEQLRASDRDLNRVQNELAQEKAARNTAVHNAGLMRGQLDTVKDELAQSKTTTDNLRNQLRQSQELNTRLVTERNIARQDQQTAQQQRDRANRDQHVRETQIESLERQVIELVSWRDEYQTSEGELKVMTEHRNSLQTSVAEHERRYTELNSRYQQEVAEHNTLKELSTFAHELSTFSEGIENLADEQRNRVSKRVDGLYDKLDELVQSIQNMNVNGELGANVGDICAILDEALGQQTTELTKVIETSSMSQSSRAPRPRALSLPNVAVSTSQAGSQQGVQAGVQQEAQAGLQQGAQAGSQQEPQAGSQQEAQAGARRADSSANKQATGQDVAMARNEDIYNVTSPRLGPISSGMTRTHSQRESAVTSPAAHTGSPEKKHRWSSLFPSIRKGKSKQQDTGMYSSFAEAANAGRSSQQGTSSSQEPQDPFFNTLITPDATQEQPSTQNSGSAPRGAPATAASSTEPTTATADDYVSPNALGVRKPYVIVNVKNKTRIDKSILPDAIKDKYKKEPEYSAHGDIKVDTSFKYKINFSNTRAINRNDPPRCFLQEIPRRAGPRGVTGRAADKYRWSWSAHDQNEPCPNVVDPSHRCFKVANETTLWLLNPSGNDWQNQEKFDRENHAAESQQSSEASAQEEIPTGGVPLGATAGPSASASAPASDPPIAPAPSGVQSTTGTSSVPGAVIPSGVPTASAASDAPRTPPRPRRSARLANAELGGDATHDTTVYEPDSTSSPVENQEQGWNDPPLTPSRHSRRHGLTRTFSVRSIKSTASGIGHRSLQALSRTMSNMSLSGRSSASTERPRIIHSVPVPIAPAPPGARFGLSGSSRPSTSGRPASFYNPPRSSASGYSGTSRHAPSHTSRGTFSDVHSHLREQHSAPPPYFNPSDRPRSEYSAGHSRTGTATTIIPPTLPEVVEEGFPVDAWVRDVEPQVTRPLTGHREHFLPSATEQRPSSGHEDNPSHARRRQLQRASYPGSARSQLSSGQGQ